MFDRLSPEAKEAMSLARAEAIRLGHPWLGTEHVLLALLRQPDTGARRILSSLGATFQTAERDLIDFIGEPCGDEPLGAEDERALRTIGVDLSAVRRLVEDAFGRGALDQGCANPGLPMMCRLKKTLERAGRQAGTGSIDAEHLLLGMVDIKRALAVELLERMAITRAAVRAAAQALRAKAS
jgi:ATP-dependent Clp protease ATP-binding subunit ClpA